MRSLSLFICLFLMTAITHAQFLDLLRLEYSIFPGNNSNYEFSRKRVLFNVPVKVKEDAYLFLGVDYSSIDLIFNEEISSFNQDDTDQFQLVDLNLAYTFKIDEDWRFGARLVPGFSSNLKEKNFLFDDTIISGAIVFIKDKKEAPDVPKPYRIIIGAAYSGNSGFAFPLPFISFYKKLHPKWSYNIGLPRTNLQFHASERVRFKLLGELEGFNSNLQGGVPINNDIVADNIRMTLFLLGTRYEFKIADHVEMFLNTTHSFNSIVHLKKRRGNVLSLGKRNGLLYKMGVRVKI